MDAGASGARAACEICNDFAVLTGTGAADVEEVDVGDVDFAGVLCAGGFVDVEVALVEDNGGVGVFDQNVLVGDVVDVAIADVGASPGFQASAVLPVEKGDVFQPGVADVVFDPWILANGSHGHSVGTVAPKILDENVGSVGLGAEAVITDIDTGVGDCQPIHVERVESIGVFGK